MCDLQQVFSLFYAVTFGAMLAGVGRFRAFAWADEYDWGPKNEVRACSLRTTWSAPRRRPVEPTCLRVRRLAWSVVCFNLLPFVLFLVELLLLPSACATDSTFWPLAWWVCVASMSVFAPYRLFHVVTYGLQRFPSWRLYSHGAFAEVFEREVRWHPWQMLWHSLSAAFYLACGAGGVVFAKLLA